MSEPVPADLMRAAELAAYEAFKEHRPNPPALWTVLIYRALAVVLPIHEQQVRERVAAEIEQEAAYERWMRGDDA